MTVKELRELLESLPQDLPVCTIDADYSLTEPVSVLSPKVSCGRYNIGAVEYCGEHVVL